MTEHIVTDKERQGRKRAPTHPGAFLRDIVLPAVGRPKTEVAALAQISRQQLYDVLNERARITPELAVKFGKLLGSQPSVLLRMQVAYDLWHAERSINTKDIPTLAEAV